MSIKIWDKDGNNHSVSQRVFVLVMLLSTLAGLLVTSAASYVSSEWVLTWPLALGCFAGALAGTVISTVSDNVPVKVFGYALLASFMGLLMGPMIALYTTASVFKIFGLTTTVVAVCGTVGVVYPKSLEGYGVYVLGALLVLIVCQFGLIGAAALGYSVGEALTIVDWIGVFLFSAIVIYDFNRAMRVERTVANAVDCAVNVYLDFVNIFLRLLSLLGDKK